MKDASVTYSDQKPTEEEQQIHSLTLRNGLELNIGIQDQLIVVAAKISIQYPHHLVFVQAGEFLHAYNKSAYFLHKSKNYQLKIVGNEASPEIRCGFPVARHKRKLWDIFYEYKTPYIVALGRKGAYILNINRDNVDKSLLDEISSNLILDMVKSLSQTHSLRTANMVQLLLKPEQITFRLKQVVNNMYAQINKYIEKLPTNQRYFIGRDVSECLSGIVNMVYEYALSLDKKQLLTALSSKVDLLKMLVSLLFKNKTISEGKYNDCMSNIIETGNIVGGLIAKHKAI